MLRMISRMLLVVVLGVGAVVQTSGQREQPPGRYVAVDATIEPLAQPNARGNAVLRVRFAPTRTPPTRLTYQTESGPVVLADDGAGVDARAGDGLYTALGTMNLVAFRDRLLQLSRSRTAMPARAYRTRAKQAVDARIDPSRWQAGRQFDFEPWGDPASIDKNRSLLVRDTAVVEDPTRTRGSCGQTSMGVWSFGYLMEQMANTPVTGVTGAQLTRAWIDSWLTNQTVNGWTVFKRQLMTTEILDDWIAQSGGPDQPLDLSKSPFKLLAIVNRQDLRQQAAYGGTSGGELRFVFSFMPSDCTPIHPTFEVIVEFGLPISSCLGQQAWAQQWKNLATMPIGSAAYNAALEAITQQVVVSNAGGGKANGSALNQIRVNENRLDDSGGGVEWEFRQFALDPFSHLLKLKTLAQTPGAAVDKVTQLAPYVNDHEADILDDDYVVPLTYPVAVKFRAGALRYESFSYWSAPGITNATARHRFSLNTCSGCHARETDTEFRHIGLAAFGTPAPLSGFLTGTWVTDPKDASTSRFFDDLERRAVDMDALLQTSCFLVPLDVPLVASH
jgi:hypothetical protein